MLLRLLARHGALAHRGPVRPRQHALVPASAHGSQHGAAPHHHLSSRPVSALSAALLVAQPETAAQQAAAPDLGFPRDLQAHYIVEDKLLGKGGNGGCFGVGWMRGRIQSQVATAPQRAFEFAVLTGTVWSCAVLLVQRVGRGCGRMRHASMHQHCLLYTPMLLVQVPCPWSHTARAATSVHASACPRFWS